MAVSRFSPTHRWLLTAVMVAVASLAACGGDGGSSPSNGNGDQPGTVVPPEGTTPPDEGTPPEENAPPDAGTPPGEADPDGPVSTGASADCFNEAMYRAGSTWTIKAESTTTTVVAGNTVVENFLSTSTNKATVNGSVTFAGRAAFETEHENFESDSNSRSWSYSALFAGKILEYGGRSLDEETGETITMRLVPPMELPINLEPNRTYTVGPVSMEMDLPPSAAESIESTEHITTSKVTYLGQETIRVPAGSFLTCKVHEVVENKAIANVVVPGVGNLLVTTTTTTDADTWTVASGPYRGLLVRSVAETEVISQGGATTQSSVETNATELSADFR